MSKYSLTFLLLSSVSHAQGTGVDSQSTGNGGTAIANAWDLAKCSDIDEGPEECAFAVSGDDKTQEALANFEDEYALDLCWCPSYFGDTSGAQGEAKNAVDKLCKNWHTCVHSCLKCNGGCYQQAETASALIALMYGIGYYYDVEQTDEGFVCKGNTYEGQQTQQDADCGEALCTCNYEFAQELTKLIKDTLKQRSSDSDEEALKKLFTFTYGGLPTNDNTVGCVGHVVHTTTTTTEAATTKKTTTAAPTTTRAQLREEQMAEQMAAQQKIQEATEKEYAAEMAAAAEAAAIQDKKDKDSSLSTAQSAFEDEYAAFMAAEAAAAGVAEFADTGMDNLGKEDDDKAALLAQLEAAETAAEEAAQKAEDDAEKKRQEAAAQAAKLAKEKEQARKDAADKAAAAKIEQENKEKEKKEAEAAALKAEQEAAAFDASAEFGTLVESDSEGAFGAGSEMSFAVQSFDFGADTLSAQSQAVMGQAFDVSDACFQFASNNEKALTNENDSTEAPPPGEWNDGDFGSDDFGPGGFALAGNWRRR